MIDAIFSMCQYSFLGFLHWRLIWGLVMACSSSTENPFVGSFVRKMGSDGEWVSLGEEGRSLIEVSVELTGTMFEDRLIEVISKSLGVSFPSEKIMLRFLFDESKHIDLTEKACFIDFERAQKYAKRKSRSISKSSFQRAMKRFIDIGLMATSHKKSWFFFNPDVFSKNSSFSVTTNFILTKNKAKPSGMDDFFSGSECMLVPKES